MVAIDVEDPEEIENVPSALQNQNSDAISSDPEAISLVSAMSRFTCISEQRSRLLQHDSDPLSTSQPVHDHDHIVEDDQAENSLSSKTISFEDCLRDRSPRSNRHYVGYPNLTSLFPKNTVIQAKNKKYISRRQSAKT